MRVKEATLCANIAGYGNRVRGARVPSNAWPHATEISHEAVRAIGIGSRSVDNVCRSTTTSGIHLEHIEEYVLSAVLPVRLRREALRLYRDRQPLRRGVFQLGLLR